LVTPVLARGFEAARTGVASRKRRTRRVTARGSRGNMLLAKGADDPMSVDDLGETEMDEDVYSECCGFKFKI